MNTSLVEKSIILGNKWKVGRVIGRGRSSTVYAATNIHNGFKAAIKVAKPGVRLSSSLGAAANAVFHPGVVRILEDGRTRDDRAYVAMERLRGETLEAQLDRGVRFSPARAVEIACEVLSILDYAHQRHVAHRGIGIEKVFITNKGTLRLLGFGTTDARRLRSSSPVLRSVEAEQNVHEEVTRHQMFGKTADLHDVATLVKVLIERSGHVMPLALADVVKKARSLPGFDNVEALQLALMEAALGLADANDAWELETFALETLRMPVARESGPVDAPELCVDIPVYEELPPPAIEKTLMSVPSPFAEPPPSPRNFPTVKVSRREPFLDTLRTVFVPAYFAFVAVATVATMFIVR